MDIFFTQRRKYTVFNSIESVRADFESITSRHWYDFSENITGRLNVDNSFRLTHKWSFAVIRWVESSPAYLTGTFMADGDKTVVDTTLRPNSVLLIFFYLFSILSICAFLGIQTFIHGTMEYELLFFPSFSLILFGLMRIFTTGLRNRFERLMQLKGAHEVPTT